MVGDDRAQVQYDAIMAANGNFVVLSGAEEARLLARLKVIWGTDTTYIKANADVDPSAHSGPDLNNPSGQAVTVSTGSGVGATTALQNIAGKGKIL